MAHFEYSSVIHAPKQKTFDFLTVVENFSLLFPEDYKFELLSPVEKMDKGSEYEFRLARFGVSVVWGIVVEEVVAGESYRDRQAHGPFDLWIHTLKVEDHGEGCLLTELIEYDLPYGIFGKLTEDLFMRGELTRIFEHRHKRLQELILAKPE